ncbi:MAG: trehalose-6-phosphate synthase, partial [Myxococcaceae bacterium]
MPRALRFVAGLVVGLALLTWGASVLVNRTTRGWFEHDLGLRSQLAVSGARRTLLARWAPEERERLGQELTELTRDERILAAAACGADGALRAATSAFPNGFSCKEIAARLGAEPGELPWVGWEERTAATGATVHVSAVTLLEHGEPVGLVVLVHDLGFIERREAKTREFLLLAFGILAAAASAITVVAARLSWRGFSNELRRLLQGGSGRPELGPILQDVRELVERISQEREADGQGGAWTAERLKHTLTRHLHGEKVVILANREPYIHERGPDGKPKLVHPASGLVTALEPVMRACSGVWVAHGA